MNIISVDLPWKEDKRNRTALAVADSNRNIRVILASDDDEMLYLIRENIEPESLILLDIGIEGCAELKDKKFRAVDIALAHQGISIQPNTGDTNRGIDLKKRIQSIHSAKKAVVQEIYPYAIYKFLAYLKDRKLLQHLNLDKFDTLLDKGFISYWPPKYKRERKDKRLKSMEYLYSLLTDTNIGLNFQTPLNIPSASSNLNQLGDEYDACLGAIVGIYFANNSSYACIAGDAKSGNMLLLADQWLSGQIGKEVSIKKPCKKEMRYETRN